MVSGYIFLEGLIKLLKVDIRCTNSNAGVKGSPKAAETVECGRIKCGLDDALGAEEELRALQQTGLDLPEPLPWVGCDVDTQGFVLRVRGRRAGKGELRRADQIAV